MEGVKVCKISEVTQGIYTVLSYESKKSTYGQSYILRIYNDDSKHELWIWSNSYLSDYISDFKPRKKFTITIDSDSKVSIKNYTRVVTLL